MKKYTVSELFLKAGFSDPKKDRELRRKLLKQLLLWEQQDAESGDPSREGQLDANGHSEEVKELAAMLGFNDLTPAEREVSDDEIYTKENIEKAKFALERAVEGSYEQKKASNFLLDAYEKGYLL